MDWTKPKTTGAASTAKPSFSSAPRRTVAPKKVKISERQIAAQVTEITAGIQYGILAAKPAWKDDELTDAELGMWGKAAAQEIMSNATLLSYWQKAEGVSSPHTRLGSVVMLIVAPRLVKHGIMPAELAAPLCGLASILVMSDNGVGTILDIPQPVPDRSGSTLRDNGKDGERKISVRESTASPETIPDFLSDESRRHSLELGHSIEVPEASPERVG